MVREIRIVFMGTPEFAVPSLKILNESNYKVVAVVTAPDKPAGRGLKVKSSPVKEEAEKHSIPVLQPEKLKDPQFLEELRSFNANLFVVVAFRMLPEVVWAMPEYGTFNLHASLLPAYRGAAPINWAIINGEKETGVTTFFLQHEIDTGDIIMQEKEKIYVEDNAETLYDRLKLKGAELVLKTVSAISNNSVNTQKQAPAENTPLAPKIFRDTCKINWDQNSFEVVNFIRGLSPYPGAWTELDGKTCKIFRASIANISSAEKPENADYLTDNKSYLYFFTKNGALSIEEIQPQGKKRMLIDEFLRGNKLCLFQQ
ncbi:methionyl-tRNA formyltransferase [Cytophagaceae bacterium ABcell3]|nr:methionyl-tRNA formyltransferase [Cytophagaceae bacterium ABcell3]